MLFGVSLAIAPGEVVTLLGRNGMGKTTTVRSIMGITPPKAGSDRASRASRSHGLPSYRIAQAGLGLVPEGRQVFPNLTVRENLVATREPRKADPWTLEARVRAVPAPREHGRATTATSSRAASSRCSPSAAR